MKCGLKKLLGPGFFLASGAVLLAIDLSLWTITAKSNNPGFRIPMPGKQNSMECGADVLYIICTLSGVRCSLEDIRTRVEISRFGTSLLHIRNAAQPLGFDVAAKRLPFRELCSRLSSGDTYAILHLKHGHFVAALGIPGTTQGSSVRLVDPATGIQDVSETELTSYGWEGKALLLVKRAPT
jgi:ABC-type bacteriocin/lantibiotic exporter with double-glycine peptidase domain